MLINNGIGYADFLQIIIFFNPYELQWLAKPGCSVSPVKNTGSKPAHSCNFCFISEAELKIQADSKTQDRHNKMAEGFSFVTQEVVYK
jgi:hypothetical protein